ncbi:hypothetical protein DSECCO2_646260 [anaerobic digester metagenome]
MACKYFPAIEAFSLAKKPTCFSIIPLVKFVNVTAKTEIIKTITKKIQAIIFAGTANDSFFIALLIFTISTSFSWPYRTL